MTKKNIYNKLPGVFQTEVQKKFFDSTVEQLFSKKNSKKLDAFIGRRVSGRYNPITDYYKPEVDKDRTWYQLEPSIVYKTDKDNVIFYQDFLNSLKFNGAETDKINRLFSTRYYSFDAPVNLDKLVNYQKYYWVVDRLPSIEISGVDDTFINTNIVGNETFDFSNFTETLAYADLPFRNSLVLSFPDSTSYTSEYIVSGNGDSIKLVERLDITFPDTYAERDMKDYFVIDVSSKENSLWSRNNRWVEKSVLDSVYQFLGQTIPTNIVRARRPIIEYRPNIKLYNFGSQFHSIVDIIDISATYSDIHNNDISVVSSILGTDDLNGKTLFLPAESNDFWQLTVSGTNVTLSSISVEVFSNGDIVYDRLGKSVWLDNVWVLTGQEKVKRNQPILYNLYDIDGDYLGDNVKYPGNNFEGSNIFFYKQNALFPIDAELGINTQYLSLSQGSDVLFENYLTSKRVQYYSEEFIDIEGYYYFLEDNEYKNMWSLSKNVTEQRVIDKFGAIDDGEDTFIMSVSPRNGLKGNIEVKVNGNIVNESDFDYFFLNGTHQVKINYPRIYSHDDIEIATKTDMPLPESSTGYYEVPKQLDINTRQEEVYEYSFGDFVGHFRSIMDSQEFDYTDSKRDGSLGQHILQPEYTLFRPMSVFSNETVSLVDSVEYIKNEYTVFKNRFIQESNNYSFSQAKGKSKLHDLIGQIVDAVTSSKTYTDTYKYGYAINTRNPINEGYLSADTTLGNDIPFVVDLNAKENTVSLYRVDLDSYGEFKSQYLLLDGIDYNLSYDDNTGLPHIEFLSDKVSDTDNILYRVFNNSDGVRIPPTTSALGISKTFVPNIYNDHSYVDPQTVILGHDGSKYICNSTYTDSQIEQIKGDTVSSIDEILMFVDQADYLLFELEKELFNNISNTHKQNNYYIENYLDFQFNPFSLEGKYTHNDIAKVWLSKFTKWTAKNRLDYQTNNTYTFGDWKTYNYSALKFRIWDNTSLSWVETDRNMPGSWRGIYLSYYKTTEPNIKPWEMLGFSIKPEWWETTTDDGDGFTGYGNDFSSANTSMWNDIENGIIRRGEFRGIGKYTYPGLSLNLPVDSSGNLRTIDDIFGVSLSDYSPEDRWKAGDIGPVEWSWLVSSEAQYDLFLCRFILHPALTGTKYWDPSRLKNVFGQYLYVDTGFKTTSDSLVHSEVDEDGMVYISDGYQRLISEYLLATNVDVSTTFGNLVRSAEVKLSHKLGGFVNSENFKLYLDFSTTSSTEVGNLLVPVENYDISLHKGSPIRDYVYSGVIIRVEENSTYGIYGYDINTMTFPFFTEDVNTPLKSISRGGKPATFMEFEFDEKYSVGTIVRYRGNFYVCDEEHVAYSFDLNYWTKLSKLPTVGGVTVKYRPQRTDVVDYIQYGTKFNTIDEVYSFLIGYGEYLEKQGWIFDNFDLNQNIENWATFADKFLFWSTTEWEEGNTLILSPGSSHLKLEVEQGYPDKVESVSKGMYSLLNESGLPIDPRKTIIDRDGKYIGIRLDEPGSGIFFARVSASETEHIITVDNRTEFNDLIYDPILGSRQPRLKLKCLISDDWTGKYEAPGYLISNNKLISNIENIVDDSRFIYSTEIEIDDSGIDSAAKHLIGYEPKEYLDALGISDNNQVKFYQGYIRDKGTWNSIAKLLRSNSIDGKESLIGYEEWAFKVADFGHTENYTTLSFKSDYKDVLGNPQIYTIHDNEKSNSLYIKEIEIYGADEVYTSVPNILIQAPTTSNGVQATAVAHLSDDMTLDYIEVTNPGSGYNTVPWVVVDGSSVDQLFAVMDSDVQFYDSENVQIVDVNILDKSQWAYRNNVDNFIDRVPLKEIDYEIDTAGYVHFNDVSYYTYNNISEIISKRLFSDDDVIWVAKLPTGTWGVMSKVHIKTLDPSEYSLTKIELDFSSVLSGTPNRNLLTSMPYTTLDSSTSVYESMMTMTFYKGGTEVSCYLVEIKDRDSNTYTISYDGRDVSANDLCDNFDSVSMQVLYDLRFRREEDLNANTVVSTGTKIWIDDLNGKWAHMYKDGDIIRQQTMSVDLSLFDSTNIYDIDGNLIGVAQPFDPIQGILIGTVARNCDFIVSHDPIEYPELDDDQINDHYPEKYLGKVWLDTSTCLLVDYNQSKLDTETSQEHIIYKKSWWGKVFPGSSPKVYEMIRSDVPPDQYDGPGKPIESGKYIVNRTYNRTLNHFEVDYYFWVSDSTEKISQRDVSVLDISNAMKNPSISGINWFSVCDINDGSVSVIVSDVDRTLSSRDAYIEVRYRKSLGEITHSEWEFIKEGSNNDIPNRLWDKIVDSMIGYSDKVDTIEYNDALPVYLEDKYVLRIPDRNLTDLEKYGIGTKPEQTVFRDTYTAKKIAVDFLQTEVKRIKLWQSQYSNWESYLKTSNFWKYTDWFETGYTQDNIIIKYQVETTGDIFNITNLQVGDFVRVYPSNPNQILDRYEVYQVLQDNNLRLVQREKGTIEISSEIYKNEKSGLAKDELRGLLKAAKNVWFVNMDKRLLSKLFFELVHFSISEQTPNDWAFKTSLISFVRENIEIGKPLVYEADTFQNFIDYVNDTKPYHTKIKDIITRYETASDIAEGDAYDDISSKIKVYFARVGYPGIINSHPLSYGWDVYEWDNLRWDRSADYDLTDTVNSGSFEDEYDNVIDPHNTYPEELANMSPNENIIINVSNDIVPVNNDYWDFYTWDSEAWDSPTDYDNIGEVNYRLHVSAYGNQYGNYYVVPETKYSTLMEDIGVDLSVVSIKVDSNDFIPSGENSMVWIDDELIRYDFVEYDGTNYVLSGIQRGYMGTTVSPHLSGSKVQDASYVISSTYALFKKNDIFGASANIQETQKVYSQITKVNEEGAPVDINGDPIESGTPRTTIPAAFCITNPWFTMVDITQAPLNKTVPIGDDGIRFMATTPASRYIWENKDL